MTPPLVSVCMPASRPSSYFDEALASALGQTYRNLEIIVTDDSGGLLRDAATKHGDPRIRYEANSSRLGMAGNHSRCVDLSAGRYVAFLHDDDAWRPDHLQRAVDVLEAKAHVGYVLSAADEVSAGGAFLRRRPTRFQPGEQPDPLAHMISEHFRLTVPSLGVWRREALDASPRPWPDLVTGEVAAFIDPIVSGWTIHYTAEPTVRYRIHAGQIGSQRQFDHRDGLVKLWDRYRFENPHHERLRRHTEARWLLARAGTHLEVGERVAARRDVAAAFHAAPKAGVVRSLVLLGLSFTTRPEALVRLWRRVQHTPPRLPVQTQPIGDVGHLVGD